MRIRIVTSSLVVGTAIFLGVSLAQANVPDSQAQGGKIYFADLKGKAIDPQRDAELGRQIRRGFLHDALIEEHLIRVVVWNGRAYLSGTVHSAIERARAEEIASRVKGITQVQNSLDINSPWTLKMDLAIYEAIERNLLKSPFISSDNINVYVDDGIAVLTGKVDSWQERRAASDNAYEAGAKLVVNKLAVASDGGEVFEY
jgi:osmotically-inducible protein OsmY